MPTYKTGLCEICSKKSEYLLMELKIVDGYISFGYLCPDCLEKIRKIRKEMA